MLAWIKELRENAHKLWWPIFLAFAIGGIAGFGASSFWWSGTVSTLREHVSLLQQTPGTTLLHIIEVDKGPSYRAEPIDDVIEVNNSDKTPITIFLPSGVTKGKKITVKDKRGNAGQVNINIISDAGTIDGLKMLVINVDRSSVTFIWDGKGWTFL